MVGDGEDWWRNVALAGSGVLLWGYREARLRRMRCPG